MQSDEVRRGYAARGFCAFSPWNDTSKVYSALQLYLGTNPISLLEVVSSLNSFNIADGMYHYDKGNRTAKYNPKVYLGTVQTTSTVWNSDRQNPLGDPEKSGSWPQDF